jgi:Zn-dependent peptidase ImmA (M78 family)
MRNELPLAHLIAEQKATEIIDKYGIDSAEQIRLEDIAYNLGVRILEGPLKGAAARLVRFGNTATIRVSDTETYAGRKRFSIAHELGHFILEHGTSLEVVCSEVDMHDWHQKEGYEQIANAFAGELLLPRALIEKNCDVKEVNFEPVKVIADKFQTSLTATAIKFVRFCPEMCAVIFSEDSTIKWLYRSNDFWPYIRIGKKLDKRTLAYDFFHGKELAEDPEDIDASAWIDSDKLGDLDEVVEHSIAFPRLGCVLTILWIKP